jgi:hypothetical protein
VWGLALGLAFATKFTAFLLLPGTLAVLLVSRRPDGPGDPWQADSSGNRRWLRIVAGLLAGAAGATLLVSAAYGFRRFGVPLSSVRWKSELLLRASRAFPGLALPLPADFLTGLDLVLDMERHKPLNVVILGRLHPDGVAYYFVVLWLLKTPILVLSAVAWGLVRALRDGLWLASPLARALGVNLVLHIAYFSLLFRYQTGYRFVLMCVPLACLLAGAGLRPVLEGRHGRLALALFLGVSLIEHAAYLGNPLSFTQGLVWPKREVFRLIADSNVDWGQNDDAIDGWLLAAGVPKTHLNPPHVLPGHNTIDLNLLAGVDDFEQHRWLREHASPGGHFGHTWLWFEVEPAFFERFLDASRRRPAEPWASSLCAAAGSPEPVADEHRVSVPTTPDGVNVWCVSAAAPVDLILTGQQGRCLFGLANAKLRDWEPIGPGSEVWHRLDPGLHAFALGRASGFEGRLRVSLHGAAAVARLSGRLDDDGIISPGSLAPVPGAP